MTTTEISDARLFLFIILNTSYIQCTPNPKPTNLTCKQNFFLLKKFCYTVFVTNCFNEVFQIEIQ